MSDDSWPTFTNEALADNRTWSATFDSYDQYRDLVYYVVTPAEFIAGLRAQLARVAATGQTNTTHER